MYKRQVTGGIVTARDSGWLLSWTFNRQPQFRDQPKGQLVGWIYGLFSNCLLYTSAARNELLLQYIQELGYDVDFKTSLAKLEKNSDGRIRCV